MFNSMTFNSLKLVQDHRKNSTTESYGYASKLLNILKLHAAPFIANGSSHLQPKYVTYSPKMSPLCDLIELSSNQSDFVFETPFVVQKFSHKMPYQIPSNKAPHIIGGFIGTKSQSHCLTSRRENQLNSVIIDLLNSRNIQEKLSPVNCTSIAAEVEKYFSRQKDIGDNIVKIEDSESKIISETTGTSVKTSEVLGVKPEKPICTVQPIIKSTISKIMERPDTRERVAPTIEVVAEATDQYYLKGQGSLQTDNLNNTSKKKGKRNKKAKMLKEDHSCIEGANMTKETTPAKPKNINCKSRKSRKTKQKRKMEVKQCRERQLIDSLISEGAKNIPETKNGHLKNNNKVASPIGIPDACSSPIMTQSSELFEFEIDFEDEDSVFETELCGVHSSIRNSSNLDKDKVMKCENSSISFILGGNDDMFDSDSDSDKDEGEFDKDCWQSFQNPFSTPCLVFGNNSLGGFCDDDNEEETRFEINFDDGFEILISGNVSEDYDNYNPTSQRIIEANRRWNQDKVNPYEPAKTSKVHFPPEEDLTEVQIIFLTTEDERKSPWEQFSRDRCRFRNRIQQTEAIISPILSKDHREKLYNARFN